MDAVSRVLGAVVAAVLLLASPATGAPGQPGSSRHLGAEVPVGSGIARTVVTTDASGRPTVLGIELSEAALTGLPTGENAEPGEDFPTVEYVLPLPEDVSVPPYRHVVLNWNPKGHVPQHIYDVPHFDFHFYLLSPEQRAGITAKSADLPLVQQKPEPRYMPRGYIYAPGAEEPRMGAHWADPSGPEFQGQGFSHSFIYGSYAGRLAFVEPMISKAFLDSRPDFSAQVKQPEAFAVEGYYPQRYSVRYDPGARAYRVELGELRFVQASP